MDDLSRENLISDAMRSEELQNAFMQRHAEALDEGLFKREGRDALDGAAEAEERLRKAREELLGQAGNERQRSMLGEDLNAHLTVARDDIARHVARQTLQWERSVRQQRLDLLHAKARRDFADPARLSVYADAAATAGENAETARSALYRIAIGEALTRGQHKAARDLVDRNQPHLGAQDRADLEAELGIAGQLQRGNDYLATLLPDTLPATAADTDAAHEAAWQKNLIDWAHDPEQQATNRHLIDVRFGKHHRGLQRARAELEKTVQAWMGETDSDGDPQTRRPPPAIWKRLDTEQRRDIDATLARNARGDAPSVEPPPGENVEGVQNGETLSDAEPDPLQDGDQIAQADSKERLPSAANDNLRHHVCTQAAYECLGNAPANAPPTWRPACMTAEATCNKIVGMSRDAPFPIPVDVVFPDKSRVTIPRGSRGGAQFTPAPKKPFTSE